MTATHKFEKLGSTLVPITGVKSTSVARTFNHLVSLIASL